MEETKPEPGAMWIALLAGLVVLLTGPFALAALLVMSGDGEDGLAALVQEGGSTSYLVLLGGALASLVASVLAGVSVRRPERPPALALTPFLLPLIFALGGTVFGMRDTLAALAHVSPLDRTVILLASIGEVASLHVQALAFVASGCGAVALSSMVALLAPGRGPKVVTAVSSGLLGLSLLGVAIQAVTLRGGYRAIGHASPADRLTILAGVIGEWQEAGQASSTLFLACLAVAVLGAAVLAVRSPKSVALGVGLSLVLAAVGLRGLQAVSTQQLLAPSHELTATPRVARLTIAGRVPFNELFITPGSDVPAAIDDAVFARATRGRLDAPWLGIELRPDLPRQTLLRVLQTTHFVRLNVELVGDAPKRKFEAPALFAPAVAALSEVSLSVPVRVLFTDEVCEACAGSAEWTKEGLQVKSPTGALASWTAGDVSGSGPLAALPLVEFTWTTTPEDLARAALVALSHQHLLVVRVPPPDPEPVLPKD